MHGSRLGLTTSKICMEFEDWLESTAGFTLNPVRGQAQLQLIQLMTLWWRGMGQQLGRLLLQLLMDLLLQLLWILIMLWQSIPALLQVTPSSKSEAWNCWGIRASSDKTQMWDPVHLHRFCFTLSPHIMCILPSWLLGLLTLSPAPDPGVPSLWGQRVKLVNSY